MKHLFVIIFSLFTINSYSQDTLHDVCMPYSVAKQISLDLISGDSAQNMLNFVIDELIVKTDQITTKDSIIQIYKSKEIDLTTQLNNEKLAKNSYISMYEKLETNYNQLNKQYIKQKKIKKFYKVSFWGGLIIGITSYIILFKP